MESKKVFFDCGRKSCGVAKNIEEAREVTWDKLPSDIKEQIGSKDNLHPEEFKSTWIV